MSIIPQKNLPIYIQNYTVLVSQCDQDAGIVDYTTIGILPSNVIGNRVWNIQMTGQLTLKCCEPFVFEIDLSQVNYKDKSSINFEGKLSGIVGLNDKIYNANSIINYYYDNESFILTLILDKRTCKESQIYLNLYINDNSSTTCSSTLCTSDNITCIEVSKDYKFNCSYCNRTYIFVSGTNCNCSDPSAVWNNQTLTVSGTAFIKTESYSFNLEPNNIFVIPQQGVQLSDTYYLGIEYNDNYYNFTITIT